MFEFIDAIVVFCNLPSVFVDGEEVLGADAVCGRFSLNDNDGDGDGNDNGVSGGELWSQKKPVSFSWGNNCLPRFSENSNSTAITELTQLLTSMLLIPTYAFCQKYLDTN